MNGATIPRMGVGSPTTDGNAAFSNVAGVNSQRISTVSERLAMCAQLNSPEGATLFFNLCISLSRGIDFAIANNEIPAQVSNLPKVCKLVCRRGKDCNLQAAIMVLMVTMKHACKAQWFSSQDTQEVLSLAEEVARIFNTCEGFSTEQININPTVSQIMSRYYPWLKLGHILACVDIKPGFEACAVDFHISKHTSPKTEKRIQLLVTIKDNIETSSCIITPQKANIMLNGKGVIGRTVGHTEVGPQLPTVVTSMLRYGTNLLQAIGHFDAHYIVLVAFMGDVPSSFLPVPEDYAQPDSVTVESDAELEEGPWRISLNCPITFTRIKRPAKGKGCKHLQCFDLSNFLDMNSRCPSWKCPNCNQSICYPDLRIDKKMLKILQEVAESLATVIIRTDGSWEAISGNDDNKDEPIAKPTEALQEKSDQPASSGLPNDPFNIYDLTGGDDDTVIIDVDMQEDTKPIVNPDLLNTSTYISHFTQSPAGNPVEMNQNPSAQAQGLSHSDYSTRANRQPAGVSSAPMLGHFTPSPVLTDAVSLAARQTQQAMGTNQQTSHQTSVPSATNSVQSPQTQHHQMPTGIYGGNPLSRNLSRAPTSIQALPVPLPGSSPMTSNGPARNNFSGNTSAMNNISRNTSNLPSNRDPVQQRQMFDSLMELHSTPQMRGLMSTAPMLNNTFRPTSSPQAANQQRSTTPVQSSNNPIRPTSSPQVSNQPRATTPSPVLSNTFRPTSSPQAANQPRSTTPVQSSNNPIRPTSSPQFSNLPRATTPSPVLSNTFRPTSIPQAANQSRSTTPVQASNNPTRPTSNPQVLNQPRSTTPSPVLSNTLRPTSSPQIANQPPPITPLQISNNTLRPNSSPQPTNQTGPTRDPLPHMLSAPPHLRARAQPGTPPINPQYRLLSPVPVPTAQQPSPVPRTRQPPATPIQMQTSRPNPSSVPISAPPGWSSQPVSRTQDLVDVQTEQNWQPTGRMRGSLTGRAFSENLTPFVIRPTQQTPPNLPTRSPTQVSDLQALIGGNRNLHASSEANPSQNNNSRP
ncbi:hypothetical protein V2J09_014645 [Rumex salicifolius]